MPEQTLTTNDGGGSFLEKDIVRILSYFDVFDYPLRAEQIHSHLPDNSVSEASLQPVLQSLVQRAIVTTNGLYYSLSPDPKRSAELRECREQRATTLMKRARYVARLIKSVPFVRAIFVTGSLSKGVAPEDGDIDFMIVTAPRRLWISRFLLTIIKKTLFLNSKRHFCINLFLSEHNLRFTEHSFYNAIEIETVIPLWNYGLFGRFREENSWTHIYFPNWKPTPRKDLLLPERPALVQRMLEKMLALAPLDAFDNYFLFRARRHWTKKYSHLDHDRFDRLVQCKTDISTVWAEDLKSSILQSFEKRYQESSIRLSSYQ